jgi:hypothetical protein
VTGLWQRMQDAQSARGDATLRFRHTWRRSMSRSGTSAPRSMASRVVGTGGARVRQPYPQPESMRGRRWISTHGANACRGSSGCKAWRCPRAWNRRGPAAPSTLWAVWLKVSHRAGIGHRHRSTMHA